MPGLLINIDVPDLVAGERFYTEALGLTVGRRFDDDIVELLGCDAPIYLIRKPEGSAIGPAGTSAATRGTGPRCIPTSPSTISTRPR